MSGFDEPVQEPESETFLEQEIEHLKDDLREHDRSLYETLSRGEQPSLAEKRTRSRILRQLNRTRRRLYRLRTGTRREPKRRITARVSESEYLHLQSLAEQEALSLSAYIRKQLLGEDKGSLE